MLDAAYIHVGRPIPSNLRDLTEEEKERYAEHGYVKFEEYGPEKFPLNGNYWTQRQLDRVFKGCGGSTVVTEEMVARKTPNEKQWGSLRCSHCGKYLPTGETGSFVWRGTMKRVGV